VDHANRVFRHHYTPNQEIGVDGSLVGGIDSLEMMMYTYFDERQPVHYWKKVAFNIIARMVLNSYILCKENYRGPGKLKSRYNYSVSTIESLGEEWLALKDNAGADDPWGPLGLRKLPEKKESQCIVCSTKERRQRSRIVCTRCNKGLHRACSLNTHAKCKKVRMYYFA
jgi:hypothetical protein